MLWSTSRVFSLFLTMPLSSITYKRNNFKLFQKVTRNTSITYELQQDMCNSIDRKEVQCIRNCIFPFGGRKPNDTFSSWFLANCPPLTSKWTSTIWCIEWKELSFIIVILNCTRWLWKFTCILCLMWEWYLQKCKKERQQSQI